MSRLAVLLLMPLMVSAVSWRSWDAALAEAARTGKPIMVDAVREGCRYCSEMEAAVFDDAAVAAQIEKRFVPVKVNLSREAMPRELEVEMTPSFFFFTPGATLIKTVPGAWNREDFMTILEEVLHDVP